jgi:alkylhydroperoxidase family enzyme
MRLISFFGLLLALGSASAQPEPAPAPKVAGAFPSWSGDDAWKRLPPMKNPPLPEWATVLAGPLPKTTAKMLELDYLHRDKNPLGAVLAARIRGVVATTLGSAYGDQAALADLRRAGLSDKELFVGVNFSAAELAAFAFAKQLTEEGHAITDKEFAELLKHYGPEKVTAIVHTVAYANFHNRILLALGVKGESPVVPPVAAKFDAEKWKTTAPARPSWDDVKTTTAEGPRIRVEWSEHDFDELNSTLEKQKQRPLRIPLPDKSKFADFVGREKQQAETIAWMTVSSGYQLEMTRAWFACLAAFYEEASMDRVFSNSMFWVVTRTNDCFY